MRCKHHNESLVRQQLAARQIECYCPRFHTKRGNAVLRQDAAVFPGYLFVKADLDIIGASTLQWIPGAVGLVCFGGEAAYITESILNGIRERVDTVNRSTAGFPVDLRAGDEVEIYSGPFAGYRGIFGRQVSDRDRATVFLSFIRDQQLRMELPVTQIRGTKQHRSRL